MNVYNNSNCSWQVSAESVTTNIGLVRVVTRNGKECLENKKEKRNKELDLKHLSQFDPLTSFWPADLENSDGTIKFSHASMDSARSGKTENRIKSKKVSKKNKKDCMKNGRRIEKRTERKIERENKTSKRKPVSTV